MEQQLYIICEKEWLNLKNKKLEKIETILLEQYMYNREWSLKYI